MIEELEKSNWEISRVDLCGSAYGEGERGGEGEEVGEGVDGGGLGGGGDELADAGRRVSGGHCRRVEGGYKALGLLSTAAGAGAGTGTGTAAAGGGAVGIRRTALDGVRGG